MLFRSQPTETQLKRDYPSIFAESASDSVSDRYLYIPTFKLIEGLQKQGFSVVGAKQQGARSLTNKDTAKHVVYLSHESLSREVAVNEELPLLAITNSHNAKSSFQIDTAFYRKVCSNGLLMPTLNMNSARISHYKSMQDDVIQASYKVLSSFPEQIKQVNEMKQISLSTKEKAILAESIVNLAFEEDQIKLNKDHGISIVDKIMRPRRYADQKNDLWTTFNAIQENIIKGGIRVITENGDGQRSLRKTRGVNAIDKDSKLNKEMMSMALKMMDLKAA